MDLRQLEMAVAVAENASFTRASRQLYTAQSAISRKIRLLEEELGEPIFKRVNKKVYVTPAAELAILMNCCLKAFCETNPLGLA